jgi:tetratricopeptide (TPR) repeat protein
LAEFYRGQNRNEEAAATYNELIDLQEGMGDDFGSLRVLSDNYGELGQIYKALNQEERAENVFQLAEKLQQLLLKVKHGGTSVITPDTAGITYDDDLDQIGDLYTKLDRIPQALRSYEEALMIRKEAASKHDQLPTSYLKLAVLYDEHYPDKSKAAEYYQLLIDAPRNGDVGGGRDYVQALRRLGALYAGDLKQPEKAEPLYNRALTAIAALHPRLGWPEQRQVYLSLIDLYRQQKKPVETEQSYARFLESTNSLHQHFITASYRSDDYPVFMASYFKTISEIASFYLDKKDIARAKAAYATALTETGPPFVERSHNAAKLDEMVTALEKLQAQLRELKQPEEAAKFDRLITDARARLKDLQAK